MTDHTAQDVQSLLPFYVNGTLSADETALVETALSEQPNLNDEIAALKAMRAQMQDELLPHSPGAFGFARLNRAIETETAQTPNRFSGLLGKQAWGKQALIAASAALFGAFAMLIAQPRDTQSPTAVYEPASVDITQALVRVEFAPDVTLTELTSTLSPMGIEIMSGPSALGFYELGSIDGLNAAQLLDQVSTLSALIASVEIVE